MISFCTQRGASLPFPQAPSLSPLPRLPPLPPLPNPPLYHTPPVTLPFPSYFCSSYFSFHLSFLISTPFSPCFPLCFFPPVYSLFPNVFLSPPSSCRTSSLLPFLPLFPLSIRVLLSYTCQHHPPYPLHPLPFPLPITPSYYIFTSLPPFIFIPTRFSGRLGTQNANIRFLNVSDSPYFPEKALNR